MSPHRKQVLLGIALSLAVSIVGCGQSQASPRHRGHHVRHHHHGVSHYRHHHRHVRHRGFARAPLDANGNIAGNIAGIVTVATAAGIDIKVNTAIAGKMQGFIADLVARGIHPRQIHCLNFASTHVRNSLHHRGLACDFDGSGNRFAAMNRHRTSNLAHKWGLKDGCDFNDCGHVQMSKREDYARLR